MLRTTAPASSVVHASPEAPSTETREFYQRSLALLDRAGIPFMVGGGYAMAYYTGIVRCTKDLDVFCRPLDRDRVLDVLGEQGGYRTDLTWPHFLAKAMHGEAFIDVIYRSGNGLCDVDDEWFENARPGEVWGRPVLICPVEETLWSKAYVQERDRFDGADVAHLILRQSENINWKRLLRRFECQGCERVLLAHVVMFGFIYPSERGRVPGWVMERLMASVQNEGETEQKICRGPLLSKYMYTTAVDCWGYEDVRLPPWGIMTPEDVAHFVAV